MGVVRGRTDSCQAATGRGGGEGGDGEWLAVIRTTRCRRGRKGDVLGDGLVRESKYGEAAKGAKCICTVRFGVRFARYATFKGLTCLVLVLYSVCSARR